MYVWVVCLNCTCQSLFFCRVDFIYHFCYVFFRTDSEGEDEDDEFFDCDDNVASPAAEGNGASKMNTKPVGRLRKCGRLRLLKTGEPMYIPITQVQNIQEFPAKFPFN